MMEKVLPIHVRSLLDQIIEKYDFRDYFIKIKPGSQAGDGFASDLLSITITDNLGDRKLELVCKLPPFDELQRKVFISDIVFSREAHFYDKVMPIFAKFQNEKYLTNVDQFLSYPKCYATVADNKSEHYAIVMEDLRTQGFKLWDKSKPVPIDNMRLAMRELGKFHGLSFAMKDQRPKEFAEFKQISDCWRAFFQSETMQRTLDSFFNRAINSLRSEDNKNIMRDVKNNCLPYLKHCIKNGTSDRFGVLSHGDFWNNNIMYQFNEKGSAVDIRILDWPLIHYTSPSLDLLYNLFTSTDKTLRDEEFENLLQLYHESLSKTVELLGSNAADHFTIDDLRDEMKRCGNYALLMAPMVVQVSMAGSTSNEEGGQDFNTDLDDEAQVAYHQRMNDVVGDIVRMGFYQKIDFQTNEMK